MCDNGSPIKTDEHLVVLRGMWEEMKVLNRKIDAVRTELSARIEETNRRIEETNRRIEQTNERIDALRSEFIRALTETQIRVATELVAVARSLDTVTAILRRRQVDPEEFARLEERVTRLEQRLGP